VVATPALALDLNGYRAQHNLKPLRASASLAAYAHAHAYAMAARGSLDHDGFVSHAMNSPGAVVAENVLWGCASMDCERLLPMARRSSSASPPLKFATTIAIRSNCS